MKLLATISIFAVAVSCGIAQPRWGTGGCAVAQIPDQFNGISTTGVTEWKSLGDESALYKNGVQIGSWSLTEGYWRSYDARRDAWGPKESKAPVEPPQRAVIKVTRQMPEADEGEPKDVKNDLENPLNYGVDWDKIADHRATFDGRTISCEKAHELIGKQIPDDSKKFRVTIIGTDSEQKDAMTQYAMLEPTLKDRCSTWLVTADHWSLKDGVTGQVAFKTDGHPVVYLQAPDGKVLHRQDDAKDMPMAIRKAVKAYDAKKDPDARVDPLTPTTPIHPALPVCCLAAAAAAFVYLKGKK